MPRLISSIFFTVLFSIAALGQKPRPTPTPGSLSSDEGQVIKVESRLVVVPLPSRMPPVSLSQGLKADDFRIAEEGTPQKIDSRQSGRAGAA